MSRTRTYLALLAVAAACLLAAAPAAAAPQHVQSLRAGIAWQRAATWYWQEQALRPHTRAAYIERHVTGLGYLRWLARRWSARRVAARTYAQHVPRLHDWLCIHGYEGSWGDTGAPYYGGLQMDLEFQGTYAHALLYSRGTYPDSGLPVWTADHWSPLQQMWVAERAYRTRGFYPWPNTARYCGVL